MSESEDPGRLSPLHEVTVNDVRALMGASTPHFALQLRNRIRRLIDPLPPGHPARAEGEAEIARLDRIAYSGENRGPVVEGEQALASLSTDETEGETPEAPTEAA